MTHFYYTTQPFLAWCLNHYFYNQTHYVWVAAPFYPYRGLNPRSSNPYLIYQDFYQPWKDKDNYSGFIDTQRQKLKLGVEKQSYVTSVSLKDNLQEICDTIVIDFFYPLVYRVDINQISPERLDNTQGSAADVQSNEYLIADLQEDEFDILFADVEQENSNETLLDLWSGVDHAQIALSLLRSECTS